MALHCDPRRDIERVRGPLDVLDHAAPYLGAGAKLGFDCTRKWQSEAVGALGVASDESAKSTQPESEIEFVTTAHKTGTRILEKIRAISGVLDAVLPAQLPGFVFVKIDKKQGEMDKPSMAQRVLNTIEAITTDIKWEAARPPAFVIIVGAQVALDKADEVLFHWVANFDASRDMKVWSVAKPDMDQPCAQADGSWGIAGFEAAPKAPGDECNNEPVRRWPPVLEMERAPSALL